MMEEIDCQKYDSVIFSFTYLYIFDLSVGVNSLFFSFRYCILSFVSFCGNGVSLSVCLSPLHYGGNILSFSII